MTNAAPALTELLDEQLSRVQELEALLLDEQQALVSRDMETLQGLLSRKVELLSAVEAGERQRSALVSELTPERDRLRAMDAAFTALSSPDQARNSWTDLLRALEQCRALNEANGLVIDRRQAGVQRTMELLQGEPTPPAAPGYGPGTQSSPSSGAGREITQA